MWIKSLIVLSVLCSLCTADVDKEAWKEIHGDSPLTTKEKVIADNKTREAEAALRNYTRLATRSNLAIRAIVKVAVLNLYRNNHIYEAQKMDAEWKALDGKLVKAVETRNIGDFKPISDWLALAYEILEIKLGLSVCETLRLTDLKTLNFCLPVCFKPCFYGYNNFYDHFVADERYKGLAPVISYWATLITCDIASYNIGYFFVCSPVALVVERAVKNRVAPWAAPKLYDMVCKATDLYSYNIYDAAH